MFDRQAKCIYWITHNSTPMSMDSRSIAETDEHLDSTRVSSASLPTRHELGQFFTPEYVAEFMASLFRLKAKEIELLDAGAGTGVLTAAVVRRLCEAEIRPKRIAVTAYELDGTVIAELRRTLEHCRERSRHAGIDFSCEILKEDFVSGAVSSMRNDLFSAQPPRFNVAIVNPPYRKLRSDSSSRRLLRSVGVETSNFYAAFVTLIIRLLAKDGELVAITPRSFCNGPYFKRFRDELLRTMSLSHLHLFESRAAAFGKDKVLQENIIVHAIKNKREPPEVIISSSSGLAGSQVKEHRVPYTDVVLPNDPEKFIHVDNSHAETKIFISGLQATLGDLGLMVSTGRVVDFRAKAFLRKEPSSDAAPLIYPCHFNGTFIAWPKEGSRKPNAIKIHENTYDLLVPAGVYVVVKRFSSKEERRRLVACVYDPKRISAPLVGFENHLNYFHVQSQGMPLNLAKGLAAFLNSTLVDRYFRQFSGHTQVNAADLRNLKYPALERLEALGERIQADLIDQDTLDTLVQHKLLGRLESKKNEPVAEATLEIHTRA